MGKLRESLRLFHLAENSKWSLLPVAGGLYDQHPRLLDEWAIIWEEKFAAQEEDRQNRERQMRNKGRKRGSAGW